MWVNGGFLQLQRCKRGEVHRKYNSGPLALSIKGGTIRRNSQSALTHKKALSLLCGGGAGKGRRRIHSRRKRQVIWTTTTQFNTGKKANFSRASNVRNTSMYQAWQWEVGVTTESTSVTWGQWAIAAETPEALVFQGGRAGVLSHVGQAEALRGPRHEGWFGGAPV